MKGSFTRPDGIIVLTLLLWVATVFGLSLAIDLLIYQPEKKRLITARVPEQLFPLRVPELMNLADRWQRRLQRRNEFHRLRVDGPDRTTIELRTVSRRF